ncbi:MAG TPA: choice-of-anchor D domain-containing protein, partial [Ilumatobacteraceae bacterium]|nr:choice-of-anchor D domain-containing protein [Ilumatobacteraceae bacterium]
NTAPVDIADGVLRASDDPGPLATSADGRYVVYAATSATGTPPHIARVDTATLQETVLTTPFVSAQSVDISDDGNFVAIGGRRQSALGGPIIPQVLGWTPPCATTCTTEVISVASNGQPASATNFDGHPSVSADGRYVAFVSNAANIMGFPTQPPDQVYVRDRVAGVTKLVTDTPGQPMPAELGVDRPDISPDGTQIALVQTDGGETSQVWVARSTSGYFNTAAFDLVSFGVSGAPISGPGAGEPSISATGRYVAFWSPENVALSGGSVPDGTTQIWMRERPIRLDITPAIDFGTVDVGGQSAGQNAIIINTSVAEINVSAVAPPGGPFAITASSCGGLLPAGASCTVTLVFRPTAAGPASSTLAVSGEGLSVTSTLTGVGRALVVSVGALSINPTSANYGSAPIGTSLPARTFTVRNTGSAAVALTDVTLNGTGADQFAITSNACTGSLAAGASCTIEVAATVTRDGSLTATLRVTGAGGHVAQASLRLGGAFTPTLKTNPGVVSAGELTAVIGEGFPPNIDVQLAFEGETPFATVHTDGGGTFRYTLYLLPHGVRIGGRKIVVADPVEFSDVFAPLLIELATSRPSGFSSPQFTSGVRALITRGG